MEGESPRRTPRKRDLASSDDVTTSGRITRKICITDSPKPSPDKFNDNSHVNYEKSLSPRKAVLRAKLKLQDISDILNSDSEIDTCKSPSRRRQATSIKRKIFTNSPAKSGYCSPKAKKQAHILEEQNDSILNIPVKDLLKQVKDVTAALKDKAEVYEKTLGSASKLQQLSNGSFVCGPNRPTVSPIKIQNLLNKFSSPSKFANDCEENDENLTQSVQNSNCKLAMNSKEESGKYQNQTSVSKRKSTMHESASNMTPNKIITPSTPRSTRTRRKIDLSPVKSEAPAIALKQLHNDKYKSTPKKRGREKKVNYYEDDDSGDDDASNEMKLPEKIPENACSPLKLAMSRLHVSSIPQRLPCREAEFNNVYCFVKGKLIDDIGGCMYISGVPGTGKTATVRSVIKELQSEFPKKNVPKFQFIEINGLQLTEPRQAYVQILKYMTGRKATSEQAQQLLEDMFTKSRSKTPSTIILVDELDMLCTRRQDVIYNMLDWPSKAKTCLIVITIANTMDLPERLLMGRVTSRLGLTRLTFQPYTFKQLEEIVKARLCGIQAFDADAIQFVARKVAAVSGDARRALNICRRATEIAEYSTNNSNIVLMKHVDQALLEMFTSPVVQIIKNLSKLEQLLLCAVAAIVQRTGIEKCAFKRVYDYFRTLAIFDGITVPSSTKTLSIVAKLGNYRLLLTEHSQLDITQHVMLNISSDDLHFALQNSLEKK